MEWVKLLVELLLTYTTNTYELTSVLLSVGKCNTMVCHTAINMATLFLPFALIFVSYKVVKRVCCNSALEGNMIIRWGLATFLFVALNVFVYTLLQFATT